ncbi:MULTISPECIES: amidohydrolase family protein [Kitasatospora]|uniref:amidohydrolase family protein n=1 Tax=Kitasatospora TaxID=2063 RepID=UPI0002EB4B14|nr:amidohydrolase family protein [Kitasatospora setae]
MGLLDEAGVDRAVLFGTRPHPDRFVGFLSVPLGLGAEETAALVEREVLGRGLRGIGELAPAPGGAGLVEPVLRAAADQGRLPVVVHGSAPTTAADLTTLATLARRYPDVPLVVSQLGGQHWIQAVELVRDTPNMYLELSTANVVFAVRTAVKEIPDRTLFSSDAPYGEPVLGGTIAELIDLG